MGGGDKGERDGRKELKGEGWEEELKERGMGGGVKGERDGRRR